MPDSSDIQQNSRLPASAAMARWFWERKKQAFLEGHRLPVLVETDAVSLDQRRAFINWLVYQQLYRNTLIVTDLPAEQISPPSARSDDSAQITAGQFSSALGQEFDCVVYDIFAGFHPDAVAALSGTVRAGGSFILLGPHLEKWRTFPDPDYTRLLAYPFTQAEVKGYFLDHVAASITRHRQWARLRLQHDQLRLESEYITASEKQIKRLPRRGNESATPTPEQQKLIHSVLKIRPERRQALVVIAGRGRGKSAGLGMAISAWQQKYEGDIWVTAPSKAALMSFNQFVSPQTQITYYPPDELLHQGQQLNEGQLPRLLVIDEAAAIPTSLLKRVAAIFPVILFASTTHGYEGTGQGFALKLFPALNDHFPQWKRVSLHQPIRWLRGDPLEAFIEKAFLLTHRAPKISLPTHETINLRDLRLRKTLPAELITSPDVLAQLMNLLIIAHYRTTPDDLRTLLDSPGVVIYTGWNNTQLLGAVMVSLESPFEDTDLIKSIWKGQRRPKGHLLQQSLAQQLGIREGLCMAVARVIRIAVHPNLQQQGIGSWLLANVKAALKSRIQMMGASFAGEPEVVRFWQKNGYHLVRLGTRQDHVSGAFSAMMLAATHTSGRRVVSLAKQRFKSRSRYDLMLRKYPQGYLEKLLAKDQLLTEAPINQRPDLHPVSIPHSVPSLNGIYSLRQPLHENEWKLLQLFATGARPYEVVEDLLPRIPHLSRNQGLHWLKERVADQRPADLSDLAEIRGLTGRKQVVKLLRDELQNWLQQYR